MHQAEEKNYYTNIILLLCIIALPEEITCSEGVFQDRLITLVSHKYEQDVIAIIGVTPVSSVLNEVSGIEL